MSDPVLVHRIDERRGAWVRLVMNAPRGNLLSLAMVEALDGALTAVTAQPGVRWLTVEGAGTDFCYGADIREHLPLPMQRVLPATHALFRRLWTLPMPTAAIVRGRCFGGGFELALCCDDILATEDAVFGLPEVKLAALPPLAAAVLPLRVGVSRASRAIVTGDTQPAGYWHDAGLLSLVVGHATASDAAGLWFDRALAPLSASAVGHAVTAARMTMRAQAEPVLAAAERLYLEQVLASDDAIEGVQAWAEKRAPVWKDR